jgi:hypothetical protein
LDFTQDPLGYIDDQDIEILKNELINDPSLDSAMSHLLSEAWDNVLIETTSKWIALVKWIKIFQGRHITSKMALHYLKINKKDSGAMDATYRLFVKNKVKTLSKKIFGRAAAKIGGKFIPGVGWTIAALDTVENINCVKACADGKYTEDEVPYQGIYDKTKWLWDPLLNACGL